MSNGKKVKRFDVEEKKLKTIKLKNGMEVLDNILGQTMLKSDTVHRSYYEKEGGRFE